MLKKIIRRAAPYFSNFFISTGAVLLVWMLFFDANDFISQYRLTKKAGDLAREKEYYLLKIEEVKKERKEIFGSPALVEKFARERYLMKKPSEDLYIVSED